MNMGFNQSHLYNRPGIVQLRFVTREVETACLI